MTTDGLVSIIIPARNELFLQRTIQDLLEKCTGPIQIIPILDGYWCKPEEIVEDPRVDYLHYGESRGMRNAITMAARMARGQYLMKLDAHCMIEKGMDEKLKADVPTYYSKVLADDPYRSEADCDTWIVIPRRKRLDAEKWELQDVGKPDIDYEYVSSPADDGAKGQVWTKRILERLGKPEYDIDENMTFQGSCWFMTRRYFLEGLGGMPEEGYGTFTREAQQIGLKTWLRGGKIFINKKTWYAHLHKGKQYGRMYFLNKREMDAGNAFCDDFWFNNRLEGAKYDLAWFIERFMPVPGWTPELIEQVRKK